MKYVILIHANPQPWGHPTSVYSEEGRALPPERHAEMDRQFDALLEELSASGELVTAEALGDPASATLYGWTPAGHVATEGPYAEAKEHLEDVRGARAPGRLQVGHGHWSSPLGHITGLSSTTQWPHEGVPDNPTGWLITVASRRLVDQARSERSRATREQLVVRRQQGREPPARRLTGMTPALATNRSRSCCCAVTRGSRGRRRWR
jgi:hypothetical protein